MSKNSFVMNRQRQGEMKYLLLTIVPPILAMYLLGWLADIGILPGGEIARLMYVYLPMASLLVLSYPFIFKKNHKIEIKNNLIIESNWRQNEVSRIKASQVYASRRNFLNEVILLDRSGNKLLCVEANMTNFHEFEQWLERHNIR